jgi:hypothetical protein
MAKKDWAALQRQYAREYGKNQTPPRIWCELNGLSYATAKRHIHIPDEDEIAKADCDDPNEVLAPPPRAVRVGSKEDTDQAKFEMVVSEVVMGHVYSKRMLIPDEIVEDAKSMTLYDELHRLRVENLMAADSIGRYRAMIDDASPQDIAAFEESIAAVTKTMNLNATRMESLEKTISYLNGDRMVPMKLKAEIEYKKASTDKVREEVEVIRNGDNGSEAMIVHNMLPMLDCD